MYSIKRFRDILRLETFLSGGTPAIDEDHYDSPADSRGANYLRSSMDKSSAFVYKRTNNTEPTSEGDEPCPWLYTEDGKPRG